MTSAVAGYLTPGIPEPDYDEAFDDFFQTVIVGITGLDGRYVRPRWQLDPPNMPKRDVNWVGFGVAGDTQPDAFAFQRLNEDASTTVIRHERCTVIASFYGPRASGYAALLRDGLAIDQNRAALDAENVGLVEAVGPRKFAELVKEQWLPRADLFITLNREIGRNYPVLSLLVAHGHVVTNALGFDFEAGIGLPAPGAGQLNYSIPAGSGLLVAVGG